MSIVLCLITEDTDLVVVFFFFHSLKEHYLVLFLSYHGVALIKQ